MQGTAANVTNVYMSGLSLVNSAPRLGRLWATLAAAAGAVCLSAFPDVVNRAQTWITHLGNVAAPLTGVILADYLIVQRRRLDVPALFAPGGRYRYLSGVSPATLGAVAIAVTVYYVLPASSVKAVWGIAVAGAAYLALIRVQGSLAERIGQSPSQLLRVRMVDGTAPARIEPPLSWGRRKREGRLNPRCRPHVVTRGGIRLIQRTPHGSRS